MTKPNRRTKKAAARMGKVPQGRHDSAGAANSWKLSTFPAMYPGRCAVCHESIKVGDNVQMARNNRGRIHPHCVDGKPNPPKDESRGRVITSQVKAKRRSSAAKPAKDSRVIRKSPTTSGEDEIQSMARTVLRSSDLTRVDRSDLPAALGLIVGNTVCPACERPQGEPCLDAGTLWVHRARLLQFQL